MNAKRKQTQAGFSLLEMVVVMVVGGIVIAAMGLTIRTADRNSKEGSALHRMLTDLRYAQEVAVAENRQVDFTVSAGDNAYYVTYASGGFLSNPMGGYSMYVRMNYDQYKGVNITYGTGTLSFSRTGEPRFSGAFLSSAQIVATLNNHRSIRINPQGYSFIQ